MTEGEPIPQGSFYSVRDASLVKLSTRDIFAGKSVVVFAVPGAFTPTCTGFHVPRFHTLFRWFKGLNIDRIVCISVNDAYVMKAWQSSFAIDDPDFMFLSDGNGLFTKSMNMLLDKSDLGFGHRSRRYAMVARDGIIDKILAEPDIGGDPYGVSSADSVLRYLHDGEIHLPPSITIFTRDDCPICFKAKRWLNDKKLEYEEVVMGKDFKTSALRGVAGEDKVPQIFVNGQHIGGYSDLVKREDIFPAAA